MAVGSDVGPFPHGTQARELVLMVKYGMTPTAALQADLLNGAKLLAWEGQIGVWSRATWRISSPSAAIRYKTSAQFKTFRL